jgi:hypothetical protein
MKYGFKAVVVRFFELIRYLGIQYFDSQKFDYINAQEFKDISKIPLTCLDSIVKNVFRPWYDHVLSDLMNYFDTYINQVNLINVSIFIVLIVSIIIIYFLVWKAFEDQLKELLKTSVDLINLIPESIKYMIVQKINEDEENKKE